MKSIRSVLAKKEKSNCIDNIGRYYRMPSLPKAGLKQLNICMTKIKEISRGKRTNVQQKI